MSAFETSGPGDTTYLDTWTLRSGEAWQADTGEAVILRVESILGDAATLGWPLAHAKELRDQLTQHIDNATPKPVPKTREEMAAFAKDWDAKVDAGRARQEARAKWLAEGGTEAEWQEIVAQSPPCQNISRAGG